MAITTLDQLAAGMQYPRQLIKVATPTLVIGRPHSLFYLNGLPGAAAAPSAGKGGEALTTYAGQIPFDDPPVGNTYFARLVAQTTIAGQLLLCDRIWHNSGITITSTGAQTIDSVAFPARDANGATDGVGVLVGVEVSGATGAGTPTLTLGYTNAAGADSKTATNAVPTVASSAIGAFYPFALAAGDTGVRSIQTYQQSASWTSGTIHLVAYRVLACLDLGALTPGSVDAVTGGMIRMYDNSVPFLIWIPTATTATQVTGQALWSQG